MWRNIAVIVLGLALLGGSGCTYLGLTTPASTTINSDLIAWDEANAKRTRDTIDQLKKNWAMNSAAVKELVGKKIGDTEYAALYGAITELDKILVKDVLTQEDYGRGIILFGKFLDAGGRALAASVIPRAIALFSQIRGI
jgi:hypothetical protein